MSTSKAVVPVVSMVNDLLKRNEAEMRKALPRGIALTIDRLNRTAITQISKNPAIAECDPVSIARAVMDAAHLGLEFGELKQVSIVPYNNNKTGRKEAKLMVQYQGLMAILWRGNAIKDIQTRTVYKHDVFDVEYGSDVSIRHKPAFESSEPILYYAAATLHSGKTMVEVMPLAQIEAHRDQYARGVDKKDSPWVTAFDEMAKKTVLRKLIKLLPLTVDSDIRKAMELDEKIWEADVEQARVEKFREVSAAQDVPSEDERVIALKQYKEAVELAYKQKCDIKDLLTPTPEKTDVQRLIALTDSIFSRMPSMENVGGESSHE